MIRALPSLALIAGCGSVPVVCPPSMVTALICVPPVHDYYDESFRAELAEERSELPPDSALAQALNGYEAVRKKCDSV